MFDNFEAKPDRLNRIIRLALGGIVVGLFLGVSSLDRLLLSREQRFGVLYIILSLIAGVVFGILSAWRGDRFWAQVRQWIWMKPPNPRE